MARNIKLKAPKDPMQIFAFVVLSLFGLIIAVPFYNVVIVSITGQAEYLRAGGLMLFPEIFLNLTSAHGKKRSDIVAIDRSDSCHAFHTGASCQVQEHRLSIIIHMMSKCDLRAVISIHCLTIRCPAHLASGFFLRQFILLCIGFYIFPHTQERNIHFFTEIPYKYFICIRILAPQAVIHMHHCQYKFPFFFQFFQKQKKAYRVSSSGYACNHHIFFFYHAISAYIRFYLLIHSFPFP